MPMQESVKDPESLLEQSALKVSDELRDFVSQLHKDIGEGNSDRTTWENRQDIWEKKRYGIRSPKSFPWVGAANFVIPAIDTDINNSKPAYLGLIANSPMCSFEPYGPEDVEPAKKSETLFDWRMRHQVKFYKPYALGVDHGLGRGFTVFKIGWRFETRKYTEYLDLAEIDEEIVNALYMPEVDDSALFQILAEEIDCDLTFQENVDELKRVVEEFRQGESVFEMTFVEKQENRAEVIALDPRDEVYFPTWVTDIQDSPYIDHPFWSSKNTILRRMEEGRYEEYDEDEVAEWAKPYQGQSSNKTVKQMRDGVSDKAREDEEILLHEVCGWYDVDGDGLLEKIIVTYPDSDPEKILRFIEVPYDDGEFPYVVVRRELNDAPILSSRGLPALGDDFQTGISTLFNQDIDAGTIATTPTVVSRMNSIKNLKNLRYVPGQHVETENGPADYAVVQQPNVGQQHRFASMQYLKAWANERIGSVKAAVSSINNPQGSSQLGQKTAKEIGAIESSSSALQSMDLMIWLMQLSDVYRKVQMLYDMFGDEEEYVAITGEEPQKVTRAEVKGRYNYVPNGRIDSVNPAFRMNKALSVYQLYKGNPNIDQVELDKYYLSEVDPKLPKRLMLSDEKRQQQAQMVEVQRARATQLQLGLKRAANMLDVEKEAMLAPIQGKKFAAN